MLRLASSLRPAPLLSAALRALSTPAAASAASSDAVPPYVVEAPEPTVTVLDNGVAVASVYSADGAGSSYVTTRISGVGSRFDGVGGESALLASGLGGVSGREHVSLPGIVPTFAVADLDGLKSSLATKIAGSSHASRMMDELHSTAYQGSPAGNSLGNPLEGTAESVASVTEGDLTALVGGIAGANVVVVGTGSGEHGRLVEAAEKAYGGLPGAGGKAVATAAERAAFIGSDVRIRYDSHNNATVALGFEGASWTDAKAMPLALMTTILGSFESSSGLGQNVTPAMCQEVAQHGLASSISAYSLSYSDTGLFGFVATAPDNQLDNLLWYVMPNMVRLAHGVSDEELARAKLALKVRLLSSRDGDVALGEEIAGQIQTIGRAVPLAETLARVDALTMGDVKAAANDVINDQDHALAAIGSIHELPDYNWIRRHSYMLRY